MRLFVAIDVSDHEGLFREIQASLPSGLRLASHFHITMKFLGDVDEAYVPKIRQRLSEVRFRPFSFCIDKLGRFGSRVVWLGVSPEDKFSDLHDEIDSSLPMFEDDRRFMPHITLARSRRPFSLPDIELPSLQMRAGSFMLFSSILTPDGPVYSVLGDFQGNL